MAAERSSAGARFERAEDAGSLQADLIREFLVLATWCNQKELFLQRDLLWRDVLALEPDNAEARKGLRYARDAQGHWKEPAQREVKDRNAAALPEFTKRRAEVVGGWRDRLLALLETEQADAARRASAESLILGIDPDDAVLRARRGEVRLDKAWVLAETVAGKARRAQLKQWIEQGRAQPPGAEAVQPTAADLALLPAWKQSWRLGNLRLCSQASEAETRSFLQLVTTATHLVRSLFGKEAALPPNFTVYLLDDPADRERFLAGLTDVSEAERVGWKESAGVGIPRHDAVVLWHKEPKKRLDCFARHVVAGLLRSAYGVDMRHGWAFEGLGLYLSRELVGTRSTWFLLGQPGAQYELLRGRLLAPESNWMNEALKLLKSSAPPRLADVLVRDLATLHIEDMLAGYAFSAYLLEGRATELPYLLGRLGEGEAGPAAAAAVLGTPLEQLEPRFVRWLEERH